MTSIDYSHFLKDYFASFRSSQAKPIEDQVVYCLNLVGFGGFVMLVLAFRIFSKM